ncbi:MAG: glycoside hydrolase family 88 protein [Bryobacteraceae bacterium]
MRNGLILVCLPLLGAVRSEVGLTAREQAVEILYGDSSLDYGTRRQRVLVVGGLDGDTAAAQAVRDGFQWFEESREGAGGRKRMALAAIPLSNPDREKLAFPPSGDAYATNTTSHVLWRAIAVLAPDTVLLVGSDAGGLGTALAEKPARGFGAIQSHRLEASALREWLRTNRTGAGAPASRKEMQSRLARKPGEVARQLAEHYGHEFPQAVYIPAVALMARLRMGALSDVEQIVSPLVDGGKDSLEKATSSHLSGHLVFAELARRTGNPRYLERVRAAADMGFTASGEMKESMPLHNEMSDSVFMGGPILAAAGRLTGESRYFDMCVRHMRFMRKLDLRPDGLYRHSPLDEAAWGRGNAFPALGMALTLGDLPRNHEGHAEMLAAFRAHMAALLPFQEPTGMWRQIVDVPGSYRELSATCMIAFSMLRGIKNGWLDKGKYKAAVDRAWEAVKLRVAADGVLLDVCTSTGKQKSRRDYLDRVAIFDRDPRGGAMAMMLAVEMAGLE